MTVRASRPTYGVSNSVFLALVALVVFCQPGYSACSITIPTKITSGQFFPVTWNVDGGGVARITRNDGRVVIYDKPAKDGSGTLWATSVLGKHTYTVSAPGGSCSADTDFTYTPAAVDGYDIVIIAGQSNAVGHGRGPFNDPLQSSIFDSRIVQIGRIHKSNLQVVPIGYWENGIETDGLQFWQKTEGEISLSMGLSFARLYVRHALAPNRKLLIIPAAHDGTSILQWQRATPFFSDMIDRVNAALAQPGNNRIVAFLWQQGEQDVRRDIEGLDKMTPQLYGTDLAAFFQHVRSTLNLPNLPILAGLMVPHWLTDQPALELQIKQEFENTIARVIKQSPPSALIASANLTSDQQIAQPGGDVHFSAEGEYTLGVRYWEALSTMLPPAQLPQAR